MIGRCFKLSLVLLALFLLAGGPPDDAWAYMWCSGQDLIHAEVLGSTVRLYHRNAEYNCCPDEFRYEVEISEGLILVREVEVLTIPCACVCCYNLSTAIEDVPPGTYTLELTYSYNSKWSTEITITEELLARPEERAFTEWSECMHAPPPDDLTAVAGLSNVDLAWEFPYDVDVTFHVERSPGGRNEWVEIAVLSPDQLSYGDAAAQPDTAYDYRVRSKIAEFHEFSPYSNVASVRTGFLVRLRVSKVSDQDVRLSWESSSSASYDVLRGTLPTNLVVVGSTPPQEGTIFYTDTGAGDSVFYRVERH